MRRWLPCWFGWWFLAAAGAQDGEQLFTLYCSACHGADGKGANEGAFPPLAGSRWVSGEPERAIQIVLHGIHGPIEVAGRHYELEMPPQGAMLADEPLAAILSYVRSSWGNAGSAVTPEAVAAQRAAGLDRAGPWTAEEILSRYPLPLEASVLRDLLSRSYEGDWSELPDFAKLTAANVEEEHDGWLKVESAPFEDHFAMEWEGRFEAPETGEYEFLLDADDAAELRLDGESVVAVTGLGPMDGSRSQTGKVHLDAGSHAFWVGYVEAEGQQGIALGWKVGEGGGYRWLTPVQASIREDRLPIVVGPEDGRAVIYRNFIDGTTPRAIGVGFPGGMNLAWSADHLAPELIWTGAFIDGAAKWVDRGTRPSPPAGENVVKLSAERFLPEEAKFRGYQLDAEGNPTFVATWGNQTLREGWQPGACRDGVPCLVRSLSLAGGSASLRVPLGEFAAIESDAVMARDAGRSVAELRPGLTLTFRYRLPH
ncbi:mono/diheme cytochrome c family protein [Haloferula luteola]|uniref:Mono/diheme cytochrome c family protein n=1 Tax=Haloferula luteola TaxID=595692 RepID=A0A840V4T1_9BACT|nr:PA14 domain-containing protein [Haloferula luteola]MBB5353025.1 mono/diheme cytochrome c family protein [Haloferula luteola]